MRRDERRVADPLLVPLGELVIPRQHLRHAPTLTARRRRTRPARGQVPERVELRHQREMGAPRHAYRTPAPASNSPAGPERGRDQDPRISVARGLRTPALTHSQRTRTTHRHRYGEPEPPFGAAEPARPHGARRSPIRPICALDSRAHFDVRESARSHAYPGRALTNAWPGSNAGLIRCARELSPVKRPGKRPPPAGADR